MADFMFVLGGFCFGLLAAFALAVYCRRRAGSPVAAVVDALLRAASSGGPGVPSK